MTDVEIVRLLCEHLIDESCEAPPVDPFVIASFRGVVRVEEQDQPFAGMITPEGDDLVVYLRASDSCQRRRFTVLHETGHTFLPGFAEAPRFRCEPLGTRSRVEELSDVAASELLLPRRFFAADLEQTGFGLVGVQQLAERYEASIEATALRAVDLWPKPAMLLVFRMAHKPAERGREAACEPKLRLAYAHPQGAWPFIPQHKSVGADSPFARAYEGEFVDERGDLGPSAVEDPGNVQVSACRYGDRVLALVSHAEPLCRGRTGRGPIPLPDTT